MAERVAELTGRDLQEVARVTTDNARSLFDPDATTPATLSQSAAMKSILVIYTGGTIGMVKDKESGRGSARLWGGHAPCA